MAQTDVGKTTTTDMNTAVDDYSVSHASIDESDGNIETFYDNPNWGEYLGYYKQIPELKQAIDALARWTAGKGYTADNLTMINLNLITGWGEDTFDSILMNLLITKKINGDAFAEIIRDEKSGLLVNLKPLNPSKIRIVTNRKGIIVRYEEINSGGKNKRFKPEQIFHLSNDRIANENHGVSVVESCKWVIDARNEAMSDWRMILHRNLAGVRIIEVDEDDTTQLNTLKEQWRDAINKGEVLILPKGTAQVQNINAPVNPESWIRYLENFFYQAVGVPKIILGGSQEFTEASSKIGYLTFEQVYMTEQRLLEEDIRNQLILEITFDRPVSLKDDIVGSEAKNTGQVGFQQNELTAQVGRNE